MVVKKKASELGCHKLESQFYSLAGNFGQAYLILLIFGFFMCRKKKDKRYTLLNCRKAVHEALSRMLGI